MTTETSSTLITVADMAIILRRTRSGIDKLRAKDPSFPKGLKFGDHMASRVYFVRSEVEAYLAKQLASRHQ